MPRIYIDFGDSIDSGGEVFAELDYMVGTVAVTDQGRFDTSEAVYWEVN